MRSIGLIQVASAATFVGVITVLAYAHYIPVIVLWGYVGVSLLTFVAYVLDKSAAKKGRWRTQESTLHVLSLIGGWPGALVAQGIVRHKTQKQSFQVVFWATVIVHVALVALLLYQQVDQTR